MHQHEEWVKTYRNSPWIWMEKAMVSWATIPVIQQTTGIFTNNEGSMSRVHDPPADANQPTNLHLLSHQGWPCLKLPKIWVCLKMLRHSPQSIHSSREIWSLINLYESISRSGGLEQRHKNPATFLPWLDLFEQSWLSLGDCWLARTLAHHI